MLRFFLLLLSSFFVVILSGQNYERTAFPKSYGLVLGYQGLEQNFIEIGMAKGLEVFLLSSKIGRRNKPIVRNAYANLYGSYQFFPGDDDYGIILGFAGSGGVAVGFDFNYYKFEKDFFGFRPSIGISIFGIETIYRYNIKLSGEKNKGISGHQFSLRYYLPVFVETEVGFKYGEKYRRPRK